MRSWVVIVAAAVAACFSPRFRPDLECGPNGECPPGQMCGADRICRGEVEVPDARPDAPPVACETSEQCQSPPNPCLLPGTCTADHVCDFGEVDCSAMADECNDAVCELATGACVRMPAHEAASCGAGASCGAFGPCGNFNDTCDSSGTQSRDCTRNTCQSGTCVAEGYQESAACTRVTDGTTCGTSTVTGCGTCGGFSDTCDESGSQTCTCTSFTCASDACMPSATSCNQGCSRDQSGVTCASPTVTNCSGCAYGSICAENAPAETCTCTSFTCGSGSCNANPTSCPQACTRNTDGNPCGCSVCGPIGEDLRSKTCVNGSCAFTGTCGDC